MDDNKTGEVREHLEKHVNYPASKEEIVAACEGMSHLPEGDKEWVKGNLPDGLYQNPQEVEKAMSIAQ